MYTAPFADDPMDAMRSLAGVDLLTRRALADRCQPRRLAAGEVLYRAGDEADAVHFVQSGSLVAYLDAPDGRREVVGRIGIGEAVGEMALITGKPRSTHVAALRDARLLALSRADFESILAQHPAAMLAFARGMAERLEAANRGDRRIGGRTATIALLSLTPGVDTAGMAAALGEMAASVLGAGRVAQLDAVTDDLDTSLPALEAANDLVILYAGHGAGTANAAAQRRAARQADLRLLIADAAMPPPAALVGHPALQDANGFQRVELVLRHGASIVPGAAAAWIAAIAQASGDRPLHHHLRSGPPAAAADLARLVRLALGRATGLVLSGGGARGFAHIGVMQALHDAGIVVDCIAGTSIGAIMGASAAQQWSYAEQLQRFRRTFADSDPLGDWTLPQASLVRGRRVSERLAAEFGEADILDLPVPFCCISADLDAGVARAHRDGLLWRALRASCAIPGLLPPVTGAREVLVDGGILDNFPIDALRDRRPARLIGVDIASDDRLQSGGESTEAPAWWNLAGRRRYRRVAPALPQLLMSAAMVGSRSAKATGRSAIDLLLEPPLPGIGILDWRAFDRIIEAGYAHAREVIAAYTP